MNRVTSVRPVRPTCKSVDWRAMGIATAVAAGVSLVLYLFFVPAAVGGGNAAVVMRYMASTLLGNGVLAPPATLTPGIVAAALLAHLFVSAAMTAVIAFVLHRWGLVTGLLGGALFGIFFFLLIHYSLTLLYPHFFVLNHLAVLIVHIVFGAVAGGVYELFELEPGEFTVEGTVR